MEKIEMYNTTRQVAERVENTIMSITFSLCTNYWKIVLL